MRGTNEGPLDVLLAVPFQPLTAYGADPVYRRTLGAYFGAPLGEAIARLEHELGRPLSFRAFLGDGRDGPGSRPDLMYSAHRSLTAVTLSTHLERRGLRWRALDPGERELAYWRAQLRRFRRTPPRLVALSTSFVMSAPWLQAFCALVRRELPSSVLAVGGAYYLTSAREFFSLNADVFCVGEGEERLPQLAESLREGRSLDAIAGLYLREPDGSLRCTGPAPRLKFDQLPPVNWRLAERIDPPVDVHREAGYYYVETQRGCPFRCRFCTYHTLTEYQRLSPERAAAAILDTAAFSSGYVFLIDATATFPPKRWAALLDELARRGGSPHPLLAFARVTDITEPLAARMARAGVQEVYIGQESGDQRLLDAMRKKTQVEHVPAAVRALGRHGLSAQFCFIHGYPGETDESLRATRRLLVNLNRGFETDPVVATYVLTPFHAFDFATVTQLSRLAEAGHPVGYEDASFPPQRVAEEVLATIIASGRAPHAPVCSILFDGQAHFLFTLARGRKRCDLFRWLKALERGVGIFLEEILEGTRPRAEELRRIRERVLAAAPPQRGLRRAVQSAAARVKARQTRAMRDAWRGEAAAGPHWRTRLFLAAAALRDFGRPGDAWRAWRTAAYAPRNGQAGSPQTAQQCAAEFVRAAMR